MDRQRLEPAKEHGSYANGSSCLPWKALSRTEALAEEKALTAQTEAIQMAAMAAALLFLLILFSRRR